VEADPEFELLAPVPFSTVCFRYVPAALAAGAGDPATADQLDQLNTRLMDAINRTGRVFLSHTKLRGRFAIRVAINNLRTEDADLDLVWDVVRREARALRA
jgi:aromatic-L-amino-acid decarboxylase